MDLYKDRAGTVFMRDQLEITELIIHCSGTDNEAYDFTAMKKDHIENRGWADIGYHYVIDQQGMIRAGRDLYVIGAHCRAHNKNSIGICLMGNEKFTKAQGIALLQLCIRLGIRFPITKVTPHNEYNENKTCPNISLEFIEMFNKTFKI